MKTIISKDKYLNIVSYACSEMPEWLVGLMGRIRIAWKKIRMPEKRRSFGSLNSDKTFFVIRLYPPASGFLANYLYVLGYMEYADRKGWIPVVDMQNYENIYSTVGTINGSKNVWEQYFLQPETDGKRYTLDEVYRSRNVVLSNGTMDEWYSMSYEDNEVIAWQRKQAKRCPFQPNIQKLLDNTYRKVISEGVNVVGTQVKGTFYQKYYHHNIPASINQIIERLKEVQGEWGYESVFVKSQQAEAIIALEQAFSNVIYTKDTKRFEDFHMPDRDKAFDVLIGKEDEDGRSIFESQIEYLTNIYILSKCTSLLCSNDNGCKVAFLWNEGRYEHFEIIDKGKFAGKAYSKEQGWH